MDQAKIDELMQQKAALQKELAELFATAKELVPILELLEQGTADIKRKFPEYTGTEIDVTIRWDGANYVDRDYSEGWDPTDSNFPDAIKDLKNAIQDITLPKELLMHGTITEPDANDGFGEETPTASVLYKGFTGLIAFVKQNHYPLIQQVAVVIAPLAKRQDLSEEQQLVIAALGLLTDNQYGSHGILSHIEAGADWKRIETVFAEIAKINDHLPAELRNVNPASTKTLQTAADKILAELGIKVNATGREPK